MRPPPVSAHIRKPKERGVACEVDVEEVVALRLLAELVPEHLHERAFMRGCHESELLERCGRILVSIRICVNAG
jgi:hypothetical protein